MACFRKICGKKKKQKDPPVDDIIQQLEETESVLAKQQEELEAQIEECLNFAKTNATKNRRISMRALQKKKRLEMNLEQVDNTLTTLEMQKDALKNAQTNAAILASIEKAGKALKRANIKLDGNKVQTLMDDISEQHYVGNEITTVIRKSLVLDIDEDELARELDQLQDDALNQQTIEDNAILNFPSVPTDIVFSADINTDATTQNQSACENEVIQNTTKDKEP